MLFYTRLWFQVSHAGFKISNPKIFSVCSDGKKKENHCCRQEPFSPLSAGKGNDFSEKDTERGKKSKLFWIIRQKALANNSHLAHIIANLSWCKSPLYYICCVCVIFYDYKQCKCWKNEKETLKERNTFLFFCSTFCVQAAPASILLKLTKKKFHLHSVNR